VDSLFFRDWSHYLESMPVGDAEDLEWFAGQSRRLNPSRSELHALMEYLDVDDHITFGGKA
jgi:hypothetical protein